MSKDKQENDTAQRKTTRIVGLVLILIVGSIYFRTAAVPGLPLLTKQPEGYYNHQTAGFVAGHLHVAIEPHPGLLALPDPYDPVANAPYRIHDMTLWKGKYYLYFGVAPILLLFLPVRLLTGHFLIEPAAVALFSTIGFLFAVLILQRSMRAWFRNAGLSSFVAVAVCVGIGTPILLLNQGAYFYQVPIACAFALIMPGLWALQRHLEGDMRWRWLVVAGCLWGLALASRPNYLLSTAVLAIPLWVLYARSGWDNDRVVKTVLAGFGPVFFVGVGLLVYNYARFDNPFEFGMRYQLAGQSFVETSALGIKYLLPHGAEFLWAKGWWQPYFPFFESSPEAPFGIVRYLPLTWMPIGLAFFWRRIGSSGQTGGWLLIAALLIVGLGNLFMVSIFFFQPMLRYTCDFAPALLLLGGVSALAVEHYAAWRRLVRILVLLCVTAAVGVVASVYHQRLPVASRPEAVTRLLAFPAHWMQQFSGYKHGAVRVRVELSKSSAGAVEPLFQSGYEEGRRNWLNVHYLKGGTARIGFFHAGYGELLGDEFKIPADRIVDVTIRYGSLLPPVQHPVYDGWSEADIKSARRKVQISVDEKVVLYAALDCYPSRPWDWEVGALGLRGDKNRRFFSGRIVSIEKLPLETERAVVGVIGGVQKPLAVRLQLPVVPVTGYEPLITTGQQGQSDLLFIVYGPQHTLRFGLDHYGGAPIRSEAVSYSPNEIHEVVVWMGSWAGGSGSESSGLDERLVVLFDGKVVLNTEQPFYPSGGSPTVVGRNHLKMGSAAGEFTGRIIEIEEREIKLPPSRFQPVYGAVDMLVEFPLGATTLVEPLVVTGQSGAGDFLYVKYLGSREIQFGYDHWGVGGKSSRPIVVDYSKPHRIEVDMPSLHPSLSTQRSESKVVVKLNGKKVFETQVRSHSSGPDQIFIGMNPLGGSTTRERFTGSILRLERTP